MGKMSRPPKRIWLQFHGDAHEALPRGVEIDSSDVTWCEDQIYDRDIEYVRVSKQAPLVTDEELRKLAEGAMVFISALDQLHENKIHQVSDAVRNERLEVYEIARRILSRKENKE